MLKLPNRSAIALQNNHKITEYLRTNQSVPLQALNRGTRAPTTRDTREARDASRRERVTEEVPKAEGMTVAGVGGESRKRARDDRLVGARKGRSAGPEEEHSQQQYKNGPPTTANLNGTSVPQKRKLLDAAPVSESSSARKKEGDEKRALRSKAGGTRLRSDLATYFPNFEDVVAGVPHPPDFLAYEETIQILDTAPSASRGKPIVPRATTSKPASQQSHFETFDFSSLAPNSIDIPTVDPLNDAMFLPSHIRAERREKQLRNIEKERAQHEKGQLESLLESLQGPDWLRVMGVTGITDGARKDYEPRRDYFIREVKALLRKFRVWKEAEKKLLLEKIAKDEDDNEEDASVGADAETEETDGDDNDLSTDDPDAWAARQLRIEAKSAHKSRPQQRARPRERLPPKPPKPPEPPKPFTSFFDKPHLRQAALSKGRSSGRSSRLAFGHVIPDLLELEFCLPDNFLSKEAMLANARKRQRRNRETKEAEAEAEAKAQVLAKPRT